MRFIFRIQWKFNFAFFLSISNRFNEQYFLPSNFDRLIDSKMAKKSNETNWIQ